MANRCGQHAVKGEDLGTCLVFGSEQSFQLFQRATQLLFIRLTSSGVPQLGLQLCHLEHKNTRTQSTFEQGKF